MTFDKDAPASIAPGRLSRSAGRSIFGIDPAGYHHSRLGYPETLYDHIFARVGPRPDLAVLEIGPGTGLATAALLARAPKRLVGVEVDPLLATYLRNAFDQTPVEIIESNFVDAKIDGHFDLATAAACFHWLDPVAALARLRRLLRPGGIWAMWWNIYRRPNAGDPFADAVVPLLEGIDLPPSEGSGEHYSLDARLHRETLAEAGLIDIEDAMFVRERTLDPLEMRTLYASFSFIRLLPEDRRERLLDAIADLVETRFGGAAPNVVTTPLYVATNPA